MCRKSVYIWAGQPQRTSIGTVTALKTAYCISCLMSYARLVECHDYLRHPRRDNWLLLLRPFRLHTLCLEASPTRPCTMSGSPDRRRRHILASMRMFRSLSSPSSPASVPPAQPYRTNGYRHTQPEGTAVPDTCGMAVKLLSEMTRCTPATTAAHDVTSTRMECRVSQKRLDNDKYHVVSLPYDSEWRSCSVQPRVLRRTLLSS